MYKRQEFNEEYRNIAEINTSYERAEGFNVRVNNGWLPVAGPKDVYKRQSMYQAGIKNAVAGCGTALTTEQVRVISRYADEVVLIYDCLLYTSSCV